MPQYHPPEPRTSRRPCYRASRHPPSVTHADAAGGAAFLLPTKHRRGLRWISAAQALYATWVTAHLPPRDPRRMPSLPRLRFLQGGRP
jgi:hypothetical protein